MTISTEQDAWERFVHVGSCSTRMEAELKRSALDAVGERVVVASDDAGGLHPELAARAHLGIRLLAPEHRADAVRDILAELDAGDHALPSTGERDVRDRSSTVGWWMSLALLASVLVVIGLRVSAFVG